MNMNKRHAWTALILLLAMVLASCGGATAEQPKPGKPAEPVPDEPYAAVDYNLYPTPDGGFVGDVMPFVADDGTLELYYLYDSTRNGQGYHPIYKYSTKDFHGWKDHGMVLNYGLMSDPDPALGTGCVMQDREGLYHLYYTGHNDTGNGGKGKECVMEATSTDRENWTKKEGVVFFAPDGCSKDDFRDPEVFWVDRDQCYWLLIAARDDTLGGVVLKYTSKDLKSWELVGPIFAPMAQYMLECPVMFQIGDTWYLTYSWECTTYYAMSDSMDGPFVAPRDNTLDGKGLSEGSGFLFYAAKPAKLGDKMYICGWIGRAGLTSDSGVYEWAGSVMFHQLTQNPDKTLGVKAPDVLDDYFTTEKVPVSAALQGKVTIENNNISLSAPAEEAAIADLGTRPATMMLECDFTMDDEGQAGFCFGDPTDEEPMWSAICLDGRRNLLHYEGYAIDELNYYDPAAINKFDFSRTPTHHVKLVCENEIMVLYIDDMKCLSMRAQDSINGAHLALYSYGCDAAFTNIHMYIPG